MMDAAKLSENPAAPAALTQPPAGPQAPSPAELTAFLRRHDLEGPAVLVNLPQVPFDLLDPAVAGNRGYFAYPPSSLLYVGAQLTALGVPHRIVDLNHVVLAAAQGPAEDLRERCRQALRAAIGDERRPLLCVSYMFESTRPALEFVCRFLRAEYPEGCQVLGGVSATSDPALLVREGLAHLVVSHESERALPELYAFARGAADGSLPVNLTFAAEDGTVRQTPHVAGGPVEVDIRPEYALTSVGEYQRVGSLSTLSRMNGPDVPFAAVLAKRGCRASCAFCGVRSFNGRGVRLRSGSAVVDEMSFLRERFGVEHFDWLDDDLLQDRRATLHLFEEMARRLPGITWAANNGLIATAIDRELFEAMRRSGCIGFKVGLESGNPEMIHRVHKPSGVKGFLRFAALAQDFPEIFVSVNFILGLPGERFEQMRDSLRTALRSRLSWHNFYMYQHLKNTELYREYGSLEDRIDAEHGRENSGPALGGLKAIGKDALHLYINPVRSGAFQVADEEPDLPSGYGVFDIPPTLVPPRTWVREIWFTFVTLANFLANPCLHTRSEVRLRQMIRWLEVIGMAYPQDPMMAALRYFLMDRLGEAGLAAVERQRSHAHTLLGASSYWQLRDRQFGFSAFLDRAEPVLPRIVTDLAVPSGAAALESP